MNNRAIMLGLIIATVAETTSQLLLRGQKLIGEFVIFNIPIFLHPLFTTLPNATSVLSWVVPGFFIGYQCKHKPIQHGAISGALYGLILGIIFFAIRASDLYDTDSKILILSLTVTYIIKYSFFFALTAPTGYLFAKQRVDL